MKNILCLVLLLSTAFAGKAQYRVVFKLGSYPLQHANDSIFIAGNFNNWNDHNSSYALWPAKADSVELVLQLPGGEYEYKCTRGSWKKTEAAPDGKDVDNHEFTLEG
jgi:hypothetical protein